MEKQTHAEIDMLYLDYNWDLDPSGIKFDDELSIEKLGWDHGDYFKIVYADDGKKYLMKVDKLEKFLLKGRDNGSS